MIYQMDEAAPHIRELMSDVFFTKAVHGIGWSDDERDEKVPSAHFQILTKRAQENAGVCEGAIITQCTRLSL